MGDIQPPTVPLAAPGRRCPMNVSGFQPATRRWPSFRRHSALRLPSCIFPLLVAGTLILTATTGVEQYTTAEIPGVVKDAQVGGVPGATVAAVHVASGLRVERTTDNAGRFFLPALPVGEYSLSVELHGFRQFTHKHR